MQLDDISVSKRLWIAFAGLMLVMVLSSGIVLNRSNTSMSQAIEDVISIEKRISIATRWRGQTEVAVNMVVGGAVTTDAVLAQQYDAKVKDIVGGISKIQKEITETTTDEQEKAALAKVAAARKITLDATAKTWELKAAGDAVATQAFADKELATTVDAYLKAQDEFVTTLERRRDAVQADALSRRITYGIYAVMTAASILALGLFMAWTLVRSITQPLHRAAEMTESIAKGDLTQEVQTSRQDEFGQMLRSLNAMAQRLRNVVTEVRTGVDAVSSASVEIANGNQDLSARTEQTASNLEETAASMEELTATVSQSAETARQANQLAGSAAQAAARGGEVVGEVVTSMQQITESSRKISDIIGVIDGIAFQTNILALNAAVEAARAGEQGRGFAVVASEVRSLAQRSAEAAKEIKTLINASVENVEKGSDQVAQAGQSMDEIVSSVRRVSDLIGEITASSTEQRDGIAQVNQAVTHLDQMTQQNAALVEESTAAAASMRDQAQRLADVVSVFNVGAVAAAMSPSLARSAAPMSARASARPPLASPAPARAHIASAAKAANKAAPTPSRAPAVKGPTSTPAPKPAGGDDDWESF